MAFSLTFTQCKQLTENGTDLRNFLETMNSQPEFLVSMGEIESIAELQEIQQGGCKSGAYMPAVTYHTALDTMANHSDSVEQWCGDCFPEGIVFYPETETFGGFAVKLVSVAVEEWARQFNLDGVSWD